MSINIFLVITVVALVCAVMGDFSRVEQNQFDRGKAYSTKKDVQKRKVTTAIINMMSAIDSFKVALDQRWSYRYANSANFDSAVNELRKRIKVGISNDEFGVELEKIIALGIDGHSRVRGYGWPTGNFLPFIMEAEDERFVALNPDRKSFLADSFPFLTKIDGKPIEEWCAAAAKRVPKGSPQWVRHRCLVRFLGRLDYWREELGLPKKDSVMVELTNGESRLHRVIKLPVASLLPSYGIWPAGSSSFLEDNVGYLRLPNMQKRSSLNEIKSWMPKFRNTTGIIIDVRDNDGGDRDALRLMYSYLAAPDNPPHVFTAGAYRLHRMHKEDHLAGGHFMFRADAGEWSREDRKAIVEFTRTFKPKWKLPKEQFSDWHYMVLHRLSNADIYHYDKPVIVLMNAKCFSATDIFLAGLKGVKNVLLLGTPSGGGSGGSQDIDLGGIPIQLTLSTMVSFQANGKLFDGNGVSPDVLLYPVPEYYIGGHDNLLEDALRRIKRKRRLSTKG